jgi:hypothetical protein
MNQYVVISELNGRIDVCQIASKSLSNVVFHWIQSDAMQRLRLPLANRNFALEEDANDQPVLLKGLQNIWYQSLHLTTDETIYTDESGKLIDLDAIEYADRAMASINIVKLPTLSLVDSNGGNIQQRCTYCAAIGETMFCKQFDEAPSEGLDLRWLGSKSPWYTDLPLEAVEAQKTEMKTKGLNFEIVAGLVGVNRCKISNELANGHVYRIVTDPIPEL